MHLIYIDDSRDEQLCTFSALAIPAASWNDCFTEIRDYRRELRKSDGIYVYKELHAWKFVSGRGRIAPRVVTKYRRNEIFREMLGLTAGLPGARLFNAVFPSGDDMRAFEWLLNRVNRTMQAWDSHAVLFCDEGKEKDYTRLARRMHVTNPIPSSQGAWGDGSARKNIPLDRVLEDPVFKDSRRSYFVQLADFCAYALLRKEHPIASKTRYGLDQAFYIMDVDPPLYVKEANRYDAERLGIIRPRR